MLFLYQRLTRLTIATLLFVKKIIDSLFVLSFMNTKQCHNPTSKIKCFSTEKYSYIPSEHLYQQHQLIFLLHLLKLKYLVLLDLSKIKRMVMMVNKRKKIHMKSTNVFIFTSRESISAALVDIEAVLVDIEASCVI